MRQMTEVDDMCPVLLTPQSMGAFFTLSSSSDLDLDTVVSSDLDLYTVVSSDLRWAESSRELQDTLTFGCLIVARISISLSKNWARTGWNVGEGAPSSLPSKPLRRFAAT